MKVDTSKLKKASSDISPECRLLIEQMANCRTRAENLEFLKNVRVWVYGKCELYHWIEILDRFDKILEESSRHVDGNEFILYCDTSYSVEDIHLLLCVLNFTTLLIEHSFSRHLYNSFEHLTQLISSQSMDVSLAVLNLLYMFSKRSNFIPRLPLIKKEMLFIKLLNIAERWGDPNYGLALIDCCIKNPKREFLHQLSIDYMDDSGTITVLEISDLMDACKSLSSSEVIKLIYEQLPNPPVGVKMQILHRARLIAGFNDRNKRIQFVLARLQAVSVLIYSNALHENSDRILYPGFGEELCELIDKEDNYLVDIRAAVLRTLTSMLHFDRNHNIPKPGSRLSKIIHYTGAERQAGILPILVRDCISSLTGLETISKYPISLATSLFSLLYHLASYETGGHALLRSGMMQSLICVINWAGVDLEHITFVTRAVRVIDLITNIDIVKFHQNNGLNAFIERLEKEIHNCRDEITRASILTHSHSKINDATDTILIPNKTIQDVSTTISASSERCASETNLLGECFVESSNEITIEININRLPDNHFQSELPTYNILNRNPPNCADKPNETQYKKKITCVTQRAALLKSMLNFLKKCIQDHANNNSMRNIMESSLPCSLRHIISMAEYYGPSLFLLATDVVTVYIFNEPSILSSLQDSGITNTILKALLQKAVPATREVLGSLPNIFSALCSNERGLIEFMSFEPFDKLLKVFISSDYLVAMKRRRSSDPLGDTATNLGNAMDDLIKHHPYLRTDASEAIVRLLNELVRLGSDPNYICWRANKDVSYSANKSNCQADISLHDQNVRSSNALSKHSNNENESSEEDEDDDDEISSTSQQQQQSQNCTAVPPKAHIRNNSQEREAIPLIDYIINVMKFVEAILSFSSNGEHCRQFVLHGGLKPLLQLLSLPNLPVDSPVSLTSQAVANVCKSIINLTHETNVIDTALEKLSQIISELQPLIKHGNLPGGSVLLYELLTCPKLEDGFSNADYTPLLHNMSSVHGYVVMLVHICRNASPEMRSILLQRWSFNSLSGIQLLQNLVQLYISLVWESTVLLSFCSDEPVPQSADCWEEILQLNSKNLLQDKKSQCNKNDQGIASKTKKTPEEQLRFIKSLLAASSRLGRGLAELFGTLVKLSVGSPQSRQKRNNDFLSTFTNSKFPSPDAKKIARVLSSILVNGFRHEHFVPNSVPKLRLTFLICSVGFTGPMLFDDKRSCFHLMVSQFCEENGLYAFFDMFNWALSIGSGNINSNHSYKSCGNIKTLLNDKGNDESDFPEGTGEFLDAWLQLLEKMVNPRAILDSPYSLATTRQHQSRIINFEPVFYLTEVHKLAMLAIQRIWKRKPLQNYGVSMTETIMTILKHLIKSNTMLTERFQSRLNETAIESKISGQNKKSEHDPRNETSVNADHLRILIDMGFFRKNVFDALHKTNTLEQATDYLLNHPESCCATTSREYDNTVLNASNSINQMDIDVSAISSTSTQNFENNTSKKENYVLQPNTNVFLKLKPISKETFSIFCSDTLERTFRYMEILPETVNTGADLLTIVYRCQNSSGKQKFITNMVKNLMDCMNEVFFNMDEDNLFANKKQEDIITGIKATKFNIRLKVLFLLLDEMYSDMRKDLCFALCKEQCLNLMIMILNKIKLTLEKQNCTDIKLTSPCWLSSLVDLMDAIDSVSIILQRKANMRAVCSDVWKWYDTSTGKWNLYSETNNAVIKNAFKTGERSIIINIGRQRYTINFNCMTQVSEASGSHRPVMPGLKITEAISMYNRNSNEKVKDIFTQIIKSNSDIQNLKNPEILLSLSSMSNFYTDEVGAEKNDIVSQENCLNQPKEDTDKDRKTTACIKEMNSKPTGKQQQIVLDEEPTGLSKYKTEDIIECIVCLLNPNLSLNFETKLSLLKLCARLTKNFHNAKVFVQLGGIKMLLQMNQSCGLMGFPTYAIIIIRHVLEEPKVLQESIERILSARTNQSVPVGHRDLIYILTQVSSAVARDPHIFLAASIKVLRGDYSTNPIFSFDDSKFLVKSKTLNNQNDGISSNLDNSEVISAGNNVPVKVIKDLLYAIVQPCCHYGGKQLKKTEFGIKRDQHTSGTGPGLNDCLLSSGSIEVEECYESCCCSWHIPSSGHNHNKPVLPRATIIKILADAVRSYQSFVPRIIMEHSYSPSDSILIDKQQSCLSFIIDNFLSIIRCQQNAEVSLMSRALITSLADCYGYASVQNKVVEEIHEGLIRTLLLPESSEKHTRLQVLIGLLPLLIESPMLINKIHVERSNMYRILLRQGIMTDLCKIAQYIDLSNSYTYPTIFSVLRPLEILLRLTVVPDALSANGFLSGNSSQSGNSTNSRRFYPGLTSQSSASTSSATVGGDRVIRDIIRNVLSDRRHGYEFMFNPDDFVIDSEESSNTAGISVDDEGEENQQNTPISSANTHSNGRSQLNFNRLLDDFMQNERNFGNLRSNNHHTNNISPAHTGITVTDHHRNSCNNSESGNNDNGEGESDGASSSSETAVNIDNVTMADVSTSDTNESDSNASSENDDRNDEEGEDNDENHGIEEGPDDPSETEPDDETRQFIEVFNHIYDLGSSEARSNFADIDADDEASEVGVNGGGVPQSENTEANFEEAIAYGERDLDQRTDVLSAQPAVSFINTAAELQSNMNLILSNVQLNRNETVVPTSTSAQISPPTATVDANITNEVFDVSSNISIDRVVHSTNDNAFNNIIPDNTSPLRNLESINSYNTGSNMQRRDSTRRLIFLDQQYCAPMPSFSNPTEEGQLELFNQDALHWWLEEAKHLDFESQTNACLYVGHLLIPFLINVLKVEHKIKKKTDQYKDPASSSSSHKSDIPVPIQLSSTSSESKTTGFAEPSNNMRYVGNEPPDYSIQESSSLTLSRCIPPGLDSQNDIMTPMIEIDANMERNPQLLVFDALNLDQIRPTLSNDLPQSNLNVSSNTLNDALERSSSNQTICETQCGNDIIEDERLFRNEDYENEEGGDEMNRIYLEGEESNPVFNVEHESEIQSSLIQSISENVGHVSLNSVLNNEIPETLSVLDHHVSSLNQNIVNVNNTGDPCSSSSLERYERLSSISTNLSIGFSGPGMNSPASQALSTNITNIQEITPEVRNELGSLEIPEGVDPSFLAALPEEMREEVIQEHLRMQRVRQSAQQNATQLPQDSLLEVNPEFLAALPPNIQSEVLMQQRIELQRQAAQTTNPEDPVDAASFFQNLPDSLRQAILSDMDESQIASLPPELATEAQYLRSDWENRNRLRLNVNQTNAITSSTRGGYFTARFPSSTRSTQNVGWQNSIWYDANGTPQTHNHTTIVHHHHTQLHGKPIALLLMEDENNLLDPESLTTLLSFLFIEDSKINSSRLHRIVRNLCYHVPTREWIIHALISIIQRINDEKTSRNLKKSIYPQWLKFRVDAFGFKSNVFIINKSRQEFKTCNSESFLKSCTLNINPQATHMIIRNCLDMLFVLAKHFPRSFVPMNIKNKVTADKCDISSNHPISKNNETFLYSTVALNSSMDSKLIPEYNNVKFGEFPSTSRKSSATGVIQKTNINFKNNTFEELKYNTNAKSFWDVLLNIDMSTCYRLSNVHDFPLKASPPWEWKNKKSNYLSFSDSPFITLLEMLPYKNICRSPQLTDVLVKLLSSLSINLPKEPYQFDVESYGENFKHDMSIDLKKRQATDYTFLPFQHENRRGNQNKLTKIEKSNRTIYSKIFSQLKLVVEVLTHQSSTPEGLDYVAKLINNLSLCSEVYYAILLHYLKVAILGLATEVQKSIQNLQDELRRTILLTHANVLASTSKNSQKNILEDRFTSESVVVTGQINIKSLYQFQVPAIKRLLSTSSPQPFFLRALKIFIQIREFGTNLEMNKASFNALTINQSLSQIIVLDNLWNALSACLFELEKTKDEYAVLVLQPIVEAFFLIFGSQKIASKKNLQGNNSSEDQSVGKQILMELETTNPHCLSIKKENRLSAENTRNTNNTDRASERKTQIKYDRLKLISFAEKHRSILNQILRQSHIHLTDGPFAVLAEHTRMLDFDVKRKYFQTELERIDEGVRREENTVSVRRVTVFEDSFRVLYRLGSEEWKNRFYIVFEDEEGQDAGGLLREWYVIISRDIFNPMYALFCVSPGDRVTYMINPSSYANPNHLSYFKFVGRVIAKAIHDNKLLECYFTRSFYKHILGKQVKYTDMESQDYEFYKGLDYLMKNNVSTLGYELTFSTEVQEFGVTQVRDLIPNGRDIVVTEDNKFDYVQLVCQLKMSGSIRQQLDAFLEGFYDIIPKHLISIFNEQELELLISGLPDIDIEDLKINTEYHKYTAKSNQIQWFWRALRSFDQADRAKFLQFVTGTSKVPLQGFRSLEGMNGIQKLQIHRDDRSTDRLPCAHTCFNQLDLPMYNSYDKLRNCLLKAIHECSEGFGFA